MNYKTVNFYPKKFIFKTGPRKKNTKGFSPCKLFYVIQESSLRSKGRPKN